jgi:hypothetical protein
VFYYIKNQRHVKIALISLDYSAKFDGGQIIRLMWGFSEGRLIDRGAVKREMRGALR